MAEGTFHESLNLAALWKLPLLFLCENNLYAMGTALDRSESETDIHRKAEAYRIPAEVVDGMNVVAVENAVQRAAEQVRSGSGPHFLELRTYRFRAHSMSDPDLYRTKQEIEEWKQRCPIKLFQAGLQENTWLSAEQLAAMEKSVEAEIAAAVAFAEAGAWEPVADLLKDVYAAQTESNLDRRIRT